MRAGMLLLATLALEPAAARERAALDVVEVHVSRGVRLIAERGPRDEGSAEPAERCFGRTLESAADTCR